MVSALISGASGLGSSPGRGHCVVFLGKTLYSHSASLHPGVYMGTGCDELKAMLNEAIFLATCKATNIALQVTRKNSPATPHFATAIVALRVARKVARPSTFRNVARQVAWVQHPLCNLKGFLFVIVGLQVARKIASCNMALTARESRNTPSRRFMLQSRPGGYLSRIQT